MTIGETIIKKTNGHLMKTLSNLLKLEHQMKHKKKVMKGMLMYR
jgi:hypothetical protein